MAGSVQRISRGQDKDGISQKNLIILASTFPRWQKDSVPDFVLNYARHMQPSLKSVTAIVPHYKGARLREVFDGITVRRFRYAFPAKLENIAYGQFRKTPFYPLKVGLYAVSEFWTTLLICIRKRPAVINAHWIIPQGFVAILVKRVLGTKVIVSVHGADVFTLNGKYMRKIKRFVLKRADAVIVNSSVTQQACKELWPAREYPIIPMGIDTQKYHLKTVKKSKTYDILFVGRLAPSKGVLYLCEAVAELAKRRKNVRLTIVGDGPERPIIELFIQENKLEQTISLYGWVQPDKLPNYYHKADVFVGPSIESEAGRKEALGLVFAEASACGLPVVTTNAGGMTDIVKDKKTGLIVPQKDARALTAALEFLYDHPEEGREMGRLGSAYVSDNFSWQSITTRYSAIMQDVL